MANGSKTQQRQKRNAEKNASKNAKSQSKSNEKAKSVVCSICKQSWLLTVRPPELEEHAQNKHSKTMENCFPDVPK